MSKFLNNPDDIVPESLAGLAAAHPDLVTVDLENQVVLRAGGPVKNKVALVSGGGSGHEPLHGGFVGLGMLDAACAGAVFTSPVPDQMLAGSKAADGGAGVLHIVKNYTGDVLNFKMAADMLDDDGVSVETVLVNDDVAVEDSLYTAGRRGTGATVLLEKIAGAKAEQGASLQEVAAVAQRVNDRARSFGVALSSCTPPSAGSPIFQISPGEIELGVGIHGEPGRRRAQLGNAAEVAAQMATPILDDLGLESGSRVLAFVNSLGATPAIELYVLFGDLSKLLAERGIEVGRSLVGPYITSLEMAGASLTLLELDSELEALWDASVHTPALRWGV
ncbi:MAG: dihydroxyacetone kinase subunit DhaK [Gaiellales bacterium]|jgi:dihydroxyacetone kinase-like protein